MPFEYGLPLLMIIGAILIFIHTKTKDHGATKLDHNRKHTQGSRGNR